MREITHDGEVIARYISASSWKEGLSFFSDDNEFIQVGTWHYNAGKELLTHVHNVVERKITRTQEVIYVVEGSVEAKVCTVEGVMVETLTVSKGDCLVLLNCGHGYTIREDNTKVLEVKNGPYLGPERDRKRI